ncbi:hypothetical protein [Hydrogenimonas sp.]
MYNNEPTMSQIDDYDGPGSERTRKGVRRAIVSGLVIGAIYAAARLYFWDMGVDEVARPDTPVIRRY